ncbi:ABC-three component system middle component 2 [Lactobacillus acidophilus]
MKTKLFNGKFELALRILLILGQRESASLDQLLAFDFITTYASSFHLSKDNLHKLLGINYSDQNGYEYCLTALGRSIEEQLDDQYAIEYRKFLSNVIEKYSQFSSKKLMKLIDSNLMKELE